MSVLVSCAGMPEASLTHLSHLVQQSQVLSGSDHLYHNASLSEFSFCSCFGLPYLGSSSAQNTASFVILPFLSCSLFSTPNPILPVQEAQNARSLSPVGSKAHLHSVIPSHPMLCSSQLKWLI
jgi:hypothetical protein